MTNKAGREKRAALYLRVSTDGQTTDNQRLALEAVWTCPGFVER
jgi:DNA invertase Pin-like site-specific DNA recombinase